MNKLSSTNPVTADSQLEASRLTELLGFMLQSRECDRRESILFRQGKGYFQMPTAGHETTAAIAKHWREGDYLYPYYRDRALLLALGVPLLEVALSYFGKDRSSSRGRQLPNHFSDRARNIVSVASPTGLQCLPAAGTAWGLRMGGTDAVTICTIGDGAIRQGEFYEAWCFAVQESLPLVLVVEDNGYGISTRTEGLNPLRLGTIAGRIVRVNGRDARAVEGSSGIAIGDAREGRGPTILWLELDRLESHTSSDDQRVYRPKADLDTILERDPIRRLKAELVAGGLLTEDEYKDLRATTVEQVERAYREAEGANDPAACSANEDVCSEGPWPSARSLVGGSEPSTIVGAFRGTMHALLANDPRVLVFGQDVEDPKGGVFGLTKGLSNAFPGRVRNAPIAEATIAGVAAGLSIAGYKPVFEFQFIDFVAPAFNQLTNQVATLRWRTAGQWTCPLVLYAPCGGYLPAGGPWHSQTNEGWFTHTPGLRVVSPSTPDDVSSLLQAAVAGEDPVLLLLPKHLFRVPHAMLREWPDRLGEGVIRRTGRDATIVAWGNCVPLALAAADALSESGVGAEVIDLRSLSPCDWNLIRDSVARTRRLVVVQEDSRTSSFGQAIICELVRDSDMWDTFAAPPQLVSRDDVHIGYHPILERGALPSSEHIAAAVRLVVKY